MDILLVEDNSSDAYLLKEVFAAKSKSTEIHWVTDGYEALDYLCNLNQYTHAPKPDMIVLDLNMPRVSGFEVLKKVKDTSPLASIPVIILTTSRDPLDHTQCKALGADMCLSKPHSLKEYENMVQQLMSWASLAVIDSNHSQSSIN
jgi:two-component system, chemotaxis family, response regulator Rcp1